MTIVYKKNGEVAEKSNQETFREQFPPSQTREGVTTRREFLKVLTLTSGALCTATVGLAVAGSLISPAKHEPKKIAELGRMRAGQSTTFAYPTADDPCLLVHLGNDQYVAYSQKCTHLACPVYWEEKNQRIECPCHEGSFDVKTGQVLGGPPPRPLPKIELDIKDGAIYATSVKLNLAREA